MKRELYFNYISEKMQFLSFLTKQNGKLNLLNLNNHSENFYALFFNLLFGYDLKNINILKSNVESIDLVDEKQKIIIQVSATCTKTKIDNSLDGKILSSYTGYQFKFISLVEIVSGIRSSVFNNPFHLIFNPFTDIYDVNFLLTIIKALEINQLEKVFNFIKDELGNIDEGKIPSNLSSIINILSIRSTIQEVFKKINEYEIERKIKYNELEIIKDLINDFSVYFGKINEIYNSYDIEGKEVSVIVLNNIRNFYLRKVSKITNNVDLFFIVVNEVIEFVKNSANHKNDISYEDLLYCIQIVVVDAFIKCKIFKNPEGYNYDFT